MSSEYSIVYIQNLLRCFVDFLFPTRHYIIFTLNHIYYRDAGISIEAVFFAAGGDCVST